MEDDNQAHESAAVLCKGTPGFRCVSAHASSGGALEKLPVAGCKAGLMGLGRPGASGHEMHPVTSSLVVLCG